MYIHVDGICTYELWVSLRLEASDCLGLKSKVVMICQTWIPETKLWSSVKAVQVKVKSKTVIINPSFYSIIIKGVTSSPIFYLLILMRLF